MTRPPPRSAVTWRANATISCRTCTTPTQASASRRSWPSRRRATNRRATGDNPVVHPGPARDNGCRPESPTRQAMDDPILTIEEREAINSGRWFSSLSPSLRHDILRCAYVKRYKDGELICARGDAADEWSAVARGAVRVSSTSITGKQVTLTYVEPGIWFGDVAIFDGDRR